MIVVLFIAVLVLLAAAVGFAKEDTTMTIKQIQCLLLYLGYSPGAPDGIYGKNTQAALKHFQDAEGLAPTGDADSVTVDALYDAVLSGRFRQTELPPAEKTGTLAE